MNASTALLQALLARGDYLESLSQLECLKILPILESAHDEILGKIAKTHGVWTREWLQEMAGEIDEIYKAATDKAFGKVQPDLEKIAINEGAWAEAEASKILVGFSLTSPAPSLLKAVLDLPSSIGGSTLEDLFDALAINSRKAAYGAISDGMLAGDTVEQMTRRLRGEVVKRATWKTIDGKRTYVPGQYEGGALEDVSTRQARTLARTAVMHVGNQARETFYRANEDIIKSYQYVATLDDHTCLVCAESDGRVFKIDDPSRPMLPRHPDDRCLYVPVLKSFLELGLDMDEFPEGTRASMDGQVAESETYADRLEKATPAQRVVMLGPGRAALYEKGVGLDEMVKDGAAVPLKDLAKTANKQSSAA